LKRWKLPLSLLLLLLLFGGSAYANETLADAYLRQALSLVQKGNLNRAEELLGQAYKESGAANDSARLKQAAILNNLGDVQRRIAGVYKESYNRALQDGDESAKESYSVLRSKFLQSAVEQLEMSIRIKESILGPDNLGSLRSLENLGATYEELGDSLRAESIYRKVLQIRETKLGREHADSANALFELGQLCSKNGNPNEAEQLFKRASVIWSRQYGPASIPVAKCFRELGECRFQQNDFSNAKLLAFKAKAIFLQKAGRDNAEVRMCDSLIQNINGQIGQ